MRTRILKKRTTASVGKPRSGYVIWIPIRLPLFDFTLFSAGSNVEHFLDGGSP